MRTMSPHGFLNPMLPPCMGPYTHYVTIDEGHVLCPGPSSITRPYCPAHITAFDAPLHGCPPPSLGRTALHTSLRLTRPCMAALLPPWLQPYIHCVLKDVSDVPLHDSLPPPLQLQSYKFCVLKDVFDAKALAAVRDSSPLPPSSPRLQPYKHCVLKDVFDAKALAAVRDEIINNIEATYKETDLFKVG